MDCNFYIDDKKECAALTTLNCENCKFRKTREEYEKGLRDAEDNLRAKGLRAVKYYNDENTIMTTERGVEACKIEGFGNYRKSRGNPITIKGKLPSLNEYIAACRTNPHVGAKLKQETEDLIIIQLGKMKPITSPVFIRFTWHEKNRRRDKDNVAAAKKFVLDALQKAGKLVNDNNKYIKGFADIFDYGSDYGVTIELEAVEE